MTIRTGSILAFILLVIFPSAAREPVFFASCGSGTGSVRELVYSNDDIMSELVWPLDSLTTVTMGTALPVGRNFSIGISFETGMLLTRQYMTDSDYLNLPYDSRMTHFSRHTAELDYYHEFSVSLSRLFSTPLRGVRTGRRIGITPHLELRWTSMAWTGKDGYTQYGEIAGVYYPWNPFLVKNPLVGPVITWKLSRIMLLAAVSADVPLGDRFTVTGKLAATPLVYCKATDSHLRTGVFYKDTVLGGLYIEPNLRVACAITEKQTVFLSGSWIRMSGSRGDTLSGIIGGPVMYSYNDTAGMDMTRTVVSLGYRYTR